MNINNLIKKIADDLKSLPKSHNPEQEAWWLLEAATKKSKSTLIARENINLTQEEEKTLIKFIYQRTHENKPLQYILGTTPFCGLDIIVEPPILIPRPETEEWVTWLIDKLNPIKHESLNILDLCTGSGCIALALGKAMPYSKITAIDIDEEAISLAGKNKNHNRSQNVQIIHSDLYEKVEHEKFDLIVSNPPYISDDEWINLDPEVKQWESKLALAANDGLVIIKKILSSSKQFLNPNKYDIPQLVLEIGDAQGSMVENLMTHVGFKDVNILKDLAGKDRVVYGK